ncbi:LPS export ABC transporter periplasmic protein LptC [Lichenihabitans psoromatis]|uniref:LPS export ABC transporter periplasmic protein LptC n=1 Tax=Lichenihabitans psoromatis TaxID=2528642 RepID=UPI001036D31D|nr:LPS export ABC transporter periplasmic protein LptC [Lichenihabitans psoromatis]
MTDSVSPPLAFPFSMPAASDKTRAFRAARRHSRHVKLMRSVLFGGALVVTLLVIVFAIFDPFHKILPGLSVEKTSLDGTKVTMSRPKLAGYHNDGRPYVISASSAVQDIKVPNIFELRDMDAHLTMQDKTLTHVTALTGIYDSTLDTMSLTSDVHITNDAGLEMKARDAHIEFKTGSVVTKNPVTVAMRGNTIDADSMQMVDGGKQVTFEGHVHTMFLPGSDKTPDVKPAQMP